MKPNDTDPLIGGMTSVLEECKMKKMISLLTASVLAFGMAPAVSAQDISVQVDGTPVIWTDVALIPLYDL